MPPPPPARGRPGRPPAAAALRRLCGAAVGLLASAAVSLSAPAAAAAEEGQPSSPSWERPAAARCAGTAFAKDGVAYSYCEEDPGVADRPSRWWALKGADWRQCKRVDGEYKVWHSPIDIPPAPGGPRAGGQGAEDGAEDRPATLGELVALADEVALVAGHPNGVSPEFRCPLEAQSPERFCGHLAYEGWDYWLRDVHFHTPSEHLLDGARFPMEMHMVFATKADHPVYAVVGVFFDAAEEEAGPGPADALRQLWEKLPVGADGPTASLRLASLLRLDAEYVAFSGSTTTPPCNPRVRWLVQRGAMPAPRELVDAYYAALGGYPGNSRPAQPRNGRPIFWSGGGGSGGEGKGGRAGAGAGAPL